MRPSPPNPKPPARSRYRHGDLRRALVEAGVALAREGGPHAVTLREATRRAGVVPNAAYRHFASHAELLLAVRAGAVAEAARSMEAALAAVPPLPARGRVGVQARREHARARLRAVGLGYLRYAMSEPGLFRLVFMRSDPSDQAVDPAKAGESGLNPFQLLGSALDAMVECGALPAARRPGAEHAAWSAVHGLALLAIDGSLQRASAAQMKRVIGRVLEMVERGL
jgi:AcrR family transcriptional regulator